MYNIIICDKDKEMSARLCALIKAFVKSKKRQCVIDIADSYKSLYRKLAVKKYGLIFIKTEIDEQSGIAFIKRLRADKYDTDVVFLADSSENWQSGYECSALSFIVKPYSKGEIERTLSVFISKNDDMKHGIVIKNNEGKRYNISYSDIKYIDIINKDMTLHLSDNNVFNCRGNLSKLEKQLDSRFLRCHSSYIVNMDCIVSFKRYEFELDNGIKVRISKNNYRPYTDKYIEYITDKDTTNA